MERRFKGWGWALSIPADSGRVFCGHKFRAAVDGGVVWFLGDSPVVGVDTADIAADNSDLHVSVDVFGNLGSFKRRFFSAALASDLGEKFYPRRMRRGLTSSPGKGVASVLAAFARPLIMCSNMFRFWDGMRGVETFVLG